MSRWLEPAITRASLLAWEQENFPAEIWPLFYCDNNKQWVQFFNVKEMLDATILPLPKELYKYQKPLLTIEDNSDIIEG